MISRLIREVYQLKGIHALIPDYTLGQRLKEVLHALPVHLALPLSPPLSTSSKPSTLHALASSSSSTPSSSSVVHGCSPTTTQEKDRHAPLGSPTSVQRPSTRSMKHTEEATEGSRFLLHTEPSRTDGAASELLSPLTLLQLLECLVYGELRSTPHLTSPSMTAGTQSEVPFTQSLSWHPPETTTSSSSSSSSPSAFFFRTPLFTIPSVTIFSLQLAQRLLPQLGMAQLVMVWNAYSFLMKECILWYRQAGFSFQGSVSERSSSTFYGETLEKKKGQDDEMALQQFIQSFEANLHAHMEAACVALCKEASCSSSAGGGDGMGSLEWGLPSEALLPMAEGLAGSVQPPSALVWQCWARLCVAYATGMDTIIPLAHTSAGRGGGSRSRGSTPSPLLPWSTTWPPWETGEEIVSLLQVLHTATAVYAPKEEKPHALTPLSTRHPPWRSGMPFAVEVESCVAASSAASKKSDGEKAAEGSGWTGAVILPAVRCLGEDFFTALESFIIRQPSTFWSGEQREALLVLWEACGGGGIEEHCTPYRPLNTSAPPPGAAWSSSSSFCVLPPVFSPARQRASLARLQQALEGRSEVGGRRMRDDRREDEEDAPFSLPVWETTDAAVHSSPGTPSSASRPGLGSGQCATKGTAEGKSSLEKVEGEGEGEGEKSIPQEAPDASFSSLERKTMKEDPLSPASTASHKETGTKDDSCSSIPEEKNPKEDFSATTEAAVGPETTRGSRASSPFSTFLSFVRQASLAALLEMVTREVEHMECQMGNTNTSRRTSRGGGSSLWWWWFATAGSGSTFMNNDNRYSLLSSGRGGGLQQEWEGKRSVEWEHGSTTSTTASSSRGFISSSTSCTASAKNSSQYTAPPFPFPLLHPVGMEAVIRRVVELLTYQTSLSEQAAEEEGAKAPTKKKKVEKEKTHSEVGSPGMAAAPSDATPSPSSSLAFSQAGDGVLVCAVTSSTDIRVSLLLLQRLLSFPSHYYFFEHYDEYAWEDGEECGELATTASEAMQHSITPVKESGEEKGKRMRSSSSLHRTLFSPCAVRALSTLLNALTDTVLGRGGGGASFAPQETRTGRGVGGGSSGVGRGTAGVAGSPSSSSSSSSPSPLLSKGPAYRVGEREHQQLLYIARGVMHHMGPTLQRLQEMRAEEEAAAAVDPPVPFSSLELPHYFLHHVVKHFLHHSEMRFVHRPGVQLDLYTSTMLALAPYGGLEVLQQQVPILSAVATGASSISRADQILLVSRLAKVAQLSSSSLLSNEDYQKLRDGVKTILTAMMANRQHHSHSFSASSSGSSSSGWSTSRRWSKGLSPRDSRELLHVMLTLRFVDEGVITGVVQCMREETYRFSTMDLVEHLHDLGKLGVKHLELYTAVALHVLGLESSTGHSGIRLAARQSGGSSRGGVPNGSHTTTKELCLLLYTFTMVLKGLVKIVQSILSRLKLCAHQADLHDTSLVLYSFIKLHVHRHVEVSRPLCDGACSILKQAVKWHAWKEEGRMQREEEDQPRGTHPDPLLPAGTTRLRSSVPFRTFSTTGHTMAPPMPMVSPAELSSIWSSLRVLGYLHEPLLVMTKTLLEATVRSSVTEATTANAASVRQEVGLGGVVLARMGAAGFSSLPRWRPREMCSTIASMILLLSGAPPAYATPVEADHREGHGATTPSSEKHRKEEEEKGPTREGSERSSSSSSWKRSPTWSNSFGSIKGLAYHFQDSPLLRLFRTLCFRRRAAPSSSSSFTHAGSASVSRTTTPAQEASTTGDVSSPHAIPSRDTRSPSTTLPMTMFMDAPQLYLIVNALRPLVSTPSGGPSTPPLPRSPLLPPLRLSEYAALAVPCNRLATTFSSGKTHPSQAVETAVEVLLSLNAIRQTVKSSSHPSLHHEGPAGRTKPLPPLPNSSTIPHGEEAEETTTTTTTEEAEEEEDPLVQEMRTWPRPTGPISAPSFPSASSSATTTATPFPVFPLASSGTPVRAPTAVPAAPRHVTPTWTPPLPPRLWRFVCDNWGKMECSSSALREELRQSGVLLEFTTRRRSSLSGRHSMRMASEEDRFRAPELQRGEEGDHTEPVGLQGTRQGDVDIQRRLETPTEEEEASLKHIEALTAERSTAILSQLKTLSSSSSSTIAKDTKRDKKEKKEPRKKAERGTENEKKTSKRRRKEK